jgi:hypothetical protein
MVQQPPQAPRRLTKAEINANRIAAAKRRKFTRKYNRAKLQQEMSVKFPYKAVLDPTQYITINKIQIREWFRQQHILVYDPNVNNPDKAGVMWDDSWRNYRFARESDCVMFKMCWC